MKRVDLQLYVVKGVLFGELELDAGATLLAMPVTELSRLVAGARAAVLRELGPDALASRAHSLAQ